MQNYEKMNLDLQTKFAELKKSRPDLGKRRLNFSWSNWGFGMEPLQQSLARLSKYGISFIELHGNHYGDSIGYRVP